MATWRRRTPRDGARPHRHRRRSRPGAPGASAAAGPPTRPARPLRRGSSNCHREREGDLVGQPRRGDARDRRRDLFRVAPLHGQDDLGTAVPRLAAGLRTVDPTQWVVAFEHRSRRAAGSAAAAPPDARTAPRPGHRAARSACRPRRASHPPRPPRMPRRLRRSRSAPVRLRATPQAPCARSPGTQARRRSGRCRGCCGLRAPRFAVHVDQPPPQPLRGEAPNRRLAGPLNPISTMRRGAIPSPCAISIRPVSPETGAIRSIRYTWRGRTPTFARPGSTSISTPEGYASDHADRDDR